MNHKYSGRLFPVEAGQVITLLGKTTPGAERFEVELNSGNGTQSDPGDVQLHMSIRFANDIVRNVHNRGGGWGHEERHENLLPGNGSNPIQRGAVFKISIYVDNSLFFVSVDDKPFCTFQHRRPLHEIQLITVNRDIESVYGLNQITAQPVQWPTPSQNIFSSLTPKQFRAGSVVVLTATPRGNRGSFAINFRENGSERVLFHIRPYLNNGTIALNDQDTNKK